MTTRELRVGDLSHLDYACAEEGGWRVVAELTCTGCGAFQAADSDPAPEKARLAELAVRLFNSAGWRIGATRGVLCPDCAVAASENSVE